MRRRKRKIKRRKRKRIRSLIDRLKDIKNEAKEEFDNILLDSVDKFSEYENFDDYKKDMEDFSFESIFGQ